MNAGIFRFEQLQGNGRIRIHRFHELIFDLLRGWRSSPLASVQNSSSRVINIGSAIGRPPWPYSPRVEANMIDLMGDAAEKVYEALADADFDVLTRLGPR